jgi:hypothetical protein
LKGNVEEEGEERGSEEEEKWRRRGRVGGE